MRPENNTAKHNIYMRNIIANWVGYGAKLVVSFFLAPFVIHSLGDTVYGVWTLLISLTGYMGLLEVGVMTSTARHINFYIARNDPESLSKVVCTSLGFYCGVSALIAVSALVLNLLLNKIFRNIPPSLLDEAGPILFILAINVFLGFISAVFRQLLAARDRFDLINLITLAVLIISTFGTVIVLKAGHGITYLAVVQTFASGIASVLLILFSLKWGPNVDFGLRYLNLGTFKELTKFGAFAFIADIGAQLIFYTDSLVIGIFLGAAAVTIYGISTMLIENGRVLIKQVRNVLSPDLLKTGGLDNLGHIKSLVIKGTNLLMFFAVPLLVGFIVLGKEFICLWMGNEYARSYPVLVILSISQFGAIAALCCVISLMGLNKVRILASVSLGEGLGNLFLSIILVKLFKLGIMGVAIGTLVPMLFLSSMVVPIVACRTIKLRVSTFLKATFLRWGSVAVLFALMCVLVNLIPFSNSWVNFTIKLCLLLLAYVPMSLTLLFTKNERQNLSGAFKPIISWCERLAKVRF